MTVAVGTATIAVVGIGATGLAPGGEDALARAALVVGGARHLAAHCPSGAASAELRGDLRPALDTIAAADGPVTVLASGDPGFFGIVRALAERFGRERLNVLPGVSSVAAAFARAGLAWDDALVVSAHGREPRTAINAARAHPKVAILTAPAWGPAQLAAALSGLRRTIVVAERLGETGERVVVGAPEEIAAGTFTDPNVVIVFDPDRAVGPRSSLWPPQPEHGWALAERAFEHRDGMVTKAEVRALALARLAPATGSLVWDVGCGSGSVGVECARLGAAVVAIDRDAGACELTRRNANRHGVDVEVVCGPAPGALATLPDPDAAFVGGGGESLAEILDAVLARAPRRAVVALASVERVVPCQAQLAGAGMSVEATMLAASRLRPLAGAHRLDAANPVFVVAGAR